MSLGLLVFDSFSVALIVVTLLRILVFQFVDHSFELLSAQISSENFGNSCGCDATLHSTTFSTLCKLFAESSGKHGTRYRDHTDCHDGHEKTRTLAPKRVVYDWIISGQVNQDVSVFERECNRNVRE